MVVVVSGKLGSGKSYDCVRRVRDHLALGGCVRTNIKLDIVQISKSVGRKLNPLQVGTLSPTDNPQKIPTGDRRGHGSRRTIVLLDEALNWFQSSPASAKDERKATWGEWLRQSDKLGQDVWFVAQNFERSAKWIRELAQLSIEVFPLREVKIAMILPLWLLFPPFKRMYCVKKRDVRSGMVIGIELHSYSPKVWSLYDTSETFGFEGAESAYNGLRLWPKYVAPVWAFISSLTVSLLCGVVIGILFLFY